MAARSRPHTARSASSRLFAWLGSISDQASNSPQHCARVDTSRRPNWRKIPPLALRRQGPRKRAAVDRANNVAVEVKDLRKDYGAQRRAHGLDMTVRVGRCWRCSPQRLGQEHAASLHQPPRRLWDSGTLRVGGRRLGFHDDGKRLTPRAVAMSAPASASHGVPAIQFVQPSHRQGNVAGPALGHGMTRIDADRRADELLERVGLSHRANALPRHLSAASQKRVAIARRAAPNPSVLLLRRADLGARIPNSSTRCWR